MRLLLSLLVPVVLATGCATAPKPLQGDYSASVPVGDTPSSQRVRWGGEIIRVDNSAERSCFEVLARPLDSRARPLRRDESAGRFLACRNGFYDPAVFERGREITVTGTINGSELRKVGEYDYRYPRVDADVIYLWREPLAYAPGADPWLYGYGYGYGWGWGWDPFWNRPPIFIHHHHGGSGHRR